MKKILLVLCLFSTAGFIYSQTENEIDFPLTIAYMGETLTHPGAIVGTELTLINNTNNQLFVTINIGAYVHPRNHGSLFASSEIGYRLTFNNGFNIHTMIGIGYFHKFLDGGIYEVIDGETDSIINSGRPKFMPSFVLGFGWDMSRQTAVPLDIFIRAQAFGEYPVNTLLIPHFAIQTGLRILL